MARVTLEGLRVRFGPVMAVDGIDLDVAEGEFVVFLGPSGCGKTTTLRCIAGLETPTEGRILFDGADVTGRDAVHRNVAMVFQFVSLYPHLTVRQNIAFPLQARGLGRREVRERLTWVTRVFDLATILDLRPAALPPGDRQKAALARAIVRRPRVLLLDEPLSAIDEQYREEMRWELRHLQKELGVTAIYVTHDQREAMSLADRIVLMRDGRVVQAGLPGELFEAPVDEFAAFFIGSPPMNFIPARREGSELVLAGGAARLALPPAMLPAAVNGPLRVGIRPQHLTPGGEPGAAFSLPVRLLGARAVGRDHWFDALLGDITLRGAGQLQGIAPGSSLCVRLDPAHVLVFAADGSRIHVGAIT